MAAFVTPCARLSLTTSFTNAALSPRQQFGRFTLTSKRPIGARRTYHHVDVVKASLGPDEAVIKLMACDMDGTLLTTDKSVTPKNIEAVSRLMDETDVIFVPATGKSRSGALKAMGVLGDKLITRYPKGVPGVFLQGLIVFDLDGDVVFESMVTEELARASAEVNKEFKLDLIAYSRDSIVTDRLSEFTDLLPTYHEPVAEDIGDWGNVIGSKTLNKMIFMADGSRIDEVRPHIQKRIGHLCHLTQAQDNMLEVLPPDANKGDGVRRLLKHLGVDPGNVLAIGDAENDVELLKMVGYSCVVSNALPSAAAAAKYRGFSSNDEHGVADAILRFLLPASVGSK